jgi:hypothetical protein
VALSSFLRKTIMKNAKGVELEYKAKTCMELTFSNHIAAHLHDLFPMICYKSRNQRFTNVNKHYSLSNG